MIQPDGFIFDQMQVGGVDEGEGKGGFAAHPDGLGHGCGLATGAKAFICGKPKPLMIETKIAMKR